MKYLLPSIAALIISLGIFAYVPMANAAPFDPFADLCARDPNATVCVEKQKQQDLANNSIYGKNGIIMKITRIIAIAVGVASVVMVIIGGFKYVLSGGDSNSTNSARNTVLYAIIGLLIAVTAPIIVGFIVGKL